MKARPIGKATIRNTNHKIATYRGSFKNPASAKANRSTAEPKRTMVGAGRDTAVRRARSTLVSFVFGAANSVRASLKASYSDPGSKDLTGASARCVPGRVEGTAID